MKGWSPSYPIESDQGSGFLIFVFFTRTGIDFA